MKKRRAILYVRVSTDEQAEKGHSLAHQEDRLRNYCAINNVEVIAFYKEDHSAKTFDRPEFTKLLEFLKKNKECADLLLFLKWDRFSRNAPEAYTMIGVLKKHKIEPQAIEQPLDLGVPENKIMLAVYLATPEVENDRRSLNVISGMRRALKDGRWLGVAPKGYKNTRDDNNKPIIVPGKDADLIRYAFEELATGHYNIDAVRRLAIDKGLNITRNGFWHLVRNPLYIGRIVIPEYKDEPATIIKGKHEPLISERVFYDAQAVLEGRKRIGVPAHHSKQDDLPIRGFLKCHECGKMLTGSGSKGNGGRYFYYHCTCGCKVRLKADVINESFNDLLMEISNNEKVIRSFEEVIGNYYRDADKEQNGELQRVNNELRLYQSRLENAQTLMLDGDLDASDYRNIKAKIQPEIERLERLQRKYGEKNPEEVKMRKWGVYVLRNLPELFTTATLEGKYKLLGSTFPEKLIFTNGRVRTIGTDSFIPNFLRNGTAFSRKKTKGRIKPTLCHIG